jgi:hypothetical protein
MSASVWSRQTRQYPAGLFKRPPSERSQNGKFRRRASVTMGLPSRLTQHEVIFNGEVAARYSARRPSAPEVPAFCACGGVPVA